MRIEDYFNLNGKQIKRFNEYESLLLEWNKKINLTSITNSDDIKLKHFVDSLTVSKYVKDKSYICDIGTGAGFPGIPLKIYNDTLNVVLVDSLNKRVQFLNTVINELNLSNVVAVHSRAEDIGRDINYREKFDVVVSRAVASLNVLVEYMLPLVKIGGNCICMKGPNIDEELENSKNAIELLGGKVEFVDNFGLPESDIKRSIIIIKKINLTNKKYPRKPGEPLKKPLM